MRIQGPPRMKAHGIYDSVMHYVRLDIEGPCMEHQGMMHIESCLLGRPRFEWHAVARQFSSWIDDRKRLRASVLERVQ